MGNRNEVHQTTQEMYTKQARNSLDQAFRRSTLPLVGGQQDGVPMPGSSLLTHLPQPPFAGEVSEEAAAFHMRVPHVADSLLNPDPNATKREKYVRGIGAYDYTNIPRVAVQVAASTDHDVVYRQVFGAMPRAPFRGLSYLPPVLQQMERMRRMGHARIAPPKPPRLEVVFANHIASEVNGFDYDTLHQEAVRFSSVARMYIEEFFPNLLDSVVFLEDGEYSKLEERLAQLGEVAEKALTPELKERILQKGNGLPPERKLIYTGAHVLMHDFSDRDIVMPLTRDDQSGRAPSAIISVGGEQERDFYESRFQLRPHLNGQVGSLPTMQLITKHAVPPYTFARLGDIPLEQVIAQGLQPEDLEGIDKMAVYDILYLREVSIRRGDFDGFIAKLSEIA